ncbi:hypothetical protein LCGC14_0176170 [marine sediment metagenome]|uniref:Uncharacterized protein n=1 Tax=marine sediment metagenome TaxID=412755 RepID=A0A0F9XTW3_9ZZZZ
MNEGVKMDEIGRSILESTQISNGVELAIYLKGKGLGDDFLNIDAIRETEDLKNLLIRTLLNILYSDEFNLGVNTVNEVLLTPLKSIDDFMSYGTAIEKDLWNQVKEDRKCEDF